jgi:hypothetical protein
MYGFVDAATSIVLAPIPSMPKISILRAPMRSVSAPMNGWPTPFATQPIAAAIEILVVLTPKSSSHDSTKTPNPCRTPRTTNVAKNRAATTYQP